MNVTIQHLSGRPSHRLKALITDNLRKLEKMYAPIAEAHVCLKTQTGSGENKCVEIKIIIPGNDLFAAKRGETFESAAKLTMDALKHQIERLRTNWEKQRSTSLQD